jgi:general secretion pathway protein D
VEIDVEVLEVDYNSLQNLGIDIAPRALAVTFSWQALSISNITDGLALGTLTIPPTSLILNLAKTNGNTRILANPTIRVIDRQKARLLIGERRPFLISQLQSVPATAGGTGTTTPTGAVTTTETRTEYRDIGLKVTLSPIVHLNNEVTIEINFEISDVGPPIVATAGSELLVPVITRNLDTFVKAKNGETRLLGGLLQQSHQETNNPIPLLGDIPGVGRLFTSGNKQRRTNDILISFTPRIVKALERPDPNIESFLSGTADSFGPPVPVPVAPSPAPVVPPAPRPPAPPPGGSLPGGGFSPGGGSPPGGVSPPGPPQ